LFCGIPAVELEADEPPEPEAEAEGAEVGIVELLLDPPPHPAAAKAIAATTATVAASKRDLRMTSFLSPERHTSGEWLVDSPVAVGSCGGIPGRRRRGSLGA
jgi:hypothetical protein